MSEQQFRISKEFHFSASHQLDGLPDDHPCSRLHGHNYIFKIELQGSELDETGFLLDYRKLDFFKDEVDRLDHRHLNDLFRFNPTSESMSKFYAEEVARWLFEQGHDNVTAVRFYISETPKTWASYTVHQQKELVP